MTFTKLVTAVVVRSCASAGAPEPVEWEHGWKTKHVIATRYSNPHMGFNIGFRFPLNAYDCDAAELFEFIEKTLGGWVYEGGGSPGAEIFAVFRDVKDRESANVM